MEEYDDPLTLELRTPREIAVTMYAFGVGSVNLLSQNRIAGAAASSNIQIRMASEHTDRVTEALDTYSDGGLMTQDGIMSSSAAIGRLREEDERDPDEVASGQL